MALIDNDYIRTKIIEDVARNVPAFTISYSGVWQWFLTWQEKEYFASFEDFARLANEVLTR